VLVGHSLGGLIVRIYQQEYPTDVVGMVLVDPTHEDVRLSLNNHLVRMRLLAKDRAIPVVHTLVDGPPTPATGEWLKQCQQMAQSARIEPPYSVLPPLMQQYRLWAMRHPRCAAPQDNFLAEEIAAIYAARQLDPQPLKSLPLVVITGTQGDVPPSTDTAAWRREKADHMKDLSHLSSAGRLISDAHSGHHVQLDDPTAVVAAIEEVMKAARYGRSASST